MKKGFNQRLSQLERRVQAIPTWPLIAAIALAIVLAAGWADKETNLSNWRPSLGELAPKGVKVLIENLEAIAIVSAVVLYFKEAPDRRDRKHYEAWQVIDQAHGVETSYARYKALQDLNEEGVSLQGLDTPGADLQQIVLPGADLREADLREADLMSANFREADLRKADLSRADLRGADLIAANLCEATLSGATLSRADLRKADLRESDLSEADFRRANLTGANLCEATFRGTDLSGAIWTDGTRCLNRDCSKRE